MIHIVSGTLAYNSVSL